MPIITAESDDRYIANLSRYLIAEHAGIENTASRNREASIAKSGAKRIKCRMLERTRSSATRNDRGVSVIDDGSERI